MSFIFSQRSLENLKGVHEDLVKVVYRALTLKKIDFSVLEGLRTPERQAQLVKQGASQTLNSRHLTGHAVDLAPYLDGSIRWDWGLYYILADAVKESAKELNIKIVWGGDWTTLKDGPHFELDRKVYP